MNPQSGNFKVYNQKGKGEGSLSSYAVEALCVDNAGGLWVGTYSGGLDYYNKQSNSFRFVDTRLSEHVLGITGPMQQGKDGIWIGTEANGIMHYNPATNAFQYYPCVQTTKPEGYPDNNVKSLLLDNNILHVGVFRGKMYDFDTNLHQYIKVYDNPGGGAIYEIKRDQYGKLLLGTYSAKGFGMLENDHIMTHDLVLDKGGAFNVPQITSFALTQNKGIYIGTRSNGLYFYNGKNITSYNTTSKSNKISGNKISAVLEDRNQNVWIGTMDGGLNVIEKRTSQFKVFSTKNGLKDNKICSIAQDRKGRIWVVTRRGISEVDLEKGVKKTVDYTSGIKIQEFSQNSILVSNDNTIYVGGDNGFITFNPDSIQPSRFLPPIVINSVAVNNVPLVKDFEDQETLNLKHDENNITITYSALSYTLSKRNKYAYKLEGIDKEWNQVEDIRRVNYANLSPGKYTFRVKGSNSDEVWNEQGTSLIIYIAPPFWWAWWAIIIYLIIILTIVYYIVRYYRVQHDLDHQLALKQQEDELHQARINLFTYLSHELRTPLSLIIGPLEDIMQKSTTPAFLTVPLQRIFENSKRLLLLVNELMDFRKQESGQFHLKAAEGDFVQFAEEIIIAFRELSANRNITLNYKIKPDVENLWFDRNLFEKVLLNLLSNAFKHTPSKGVIELIISNVELDETFKSKLEQPNPNCYLDAQQYLHISISDNGKGIPAKELSRIFDPFYQIPEQNQVNIGGTGIGLSLTKGIVELHHGAIWAESPENTGAIFNILLPYGREHLTEEEVVENYQDAESISPYLHADLLSEKVEVIEVHTGKKNLVLIVEDNAELRQYLKSCLVTHYKVIEAANGKEACEMAMQQMPDIIISDIMMPVMDGLKMCKKIKNDLLTSHIPIILLTARASMLQMKEGLELGADDYITKPFSSNILLLKLKNIMQSRENLKNLYGKRFSLESMGVEVVTADDKFMQKLYKVVENNIENPDLNIDKFCEEINMSSANLYRKIKAVTNLSPLEYVKSVRMQLASKMLKETDLSVTEISEKVGFNSLIHFSATFRKHFGFSPTKYVQNEKKNASDISE